ncbi:MULTISPECIES: hypothetical protein [unclassified Bradyrhizobium]|uniref:hypothetical protein n=1 Tax=unclassified Bradyrhizobium TaxID=2631580 RepID=UPI001FFA40CD|nr:MULTISPECIES: hypothetical protein [unclassified Bradyrhizobium]MCK1536446.1 hypothetical protein [Bradyrhizobium sp. 176]MCK1556515.1 hypothetical protein [Bradyrhizobium sp. 171]
MIARLGPLKQYDIIDSKKDWEDRTQMSDPWNSELPEGIALHAAGLTMPDDLTPELWEKLGFRLAAMTGALQWAIGDWWAYGYHKYGKRKSVAAAKSLPYEFGTLMNLGTVSRSVSPSQRNEVLSWSHHAAVTSLEPAEQTKWLDKAARGKYSVKKLREMLHERLERDFDEDEGLRARRWGEGLLEKARRALPLSEHLGLMEDSYLRLLDDKLIGDLLESSRKVVNAWTTAIDSLERRREKPVSRHFSPRQRLSANFQTAMTRLPDRH